MIDWNKKAEKLLKGRTIKKVQYMTKENADIIGWSKRPLLIVLDNDSILYSQADDEGNDGGALYIDNGSEHGNTLPVL